MQTTIRSAFITDLLLPPPNSIPNLQPSQISTFGYEAAISILQDPETFIRSSPLVTNVRAINSPSDSKNFIDVPHWCSLFNLNHLGDPERGISGEWQQFEITDKLNWGLGSSDLVYVTAMRRIPGGFESVTSPGSGVRIYGRFEILRPSELSRLSSTPTNLSAPEPDGGDATPTANTTTITNAEPTRHDYMANAPNAVPGWSDPHNQPASASASASPSNSSLAHLQPGAKPNPSADRSPSPSRSTTSSSSKTAPSKNDATGIIHFIEHNETRCNALLSLYIKATTAKSHRHMHENFKRRWGEMLKEGLSLEAQRRSGGGGGGSSRGGVGGGVGGSGSGSGDWEARRPAAGERKPDGVQGVGVDARQDSSRDGSRRRDEAKPQERTGSSMRMTVR